MPPARRAARVAAEGGRVAYGGGRYRPARARARVPDASRAGAGRAAASAASGGRGGLPLRAGPRGAGAATCGRGDRADGVVAPGGGRALGIQSPARKASGRRLGRAGLGPGTGRRVVAVTRGTTQPQPPAPHGPLDRGRARRRAAQGGRPGGGRPRLRGRALDRGRAARPAAHGAAGRRGRGRRDRAGAGRGGAAVRARGPHLPARRLRGPGARRAAARCSSGRRTCCGSTTRSRSPPSGRGCARGSAPGGLLVEGTCDEIGRRHVWVALGPEGPRTVTFATRLGSLDRPSDLAERLPKALIHRNVPGEPVHAFLRDFDRAWAGGRPLRLVRRAAALDPRGPRPATTDWPVTDGATRWRQGEVTVGWEALAPTRVVP